MWGLLHQHSLSFTLMMHRVFHENVWRTPIPALHFTSASLFCIIHPHPCTSFHIRIIVLHHSSASLHCISHQHLCFASFIRITALHLNPHQCLAPVHPHH
jgi:hypothetical protein